MTSDTAQQTDWRRGPISELAPGVWEQRTPKGIYPVKYITRHIDDVRNERVLYSRTGRLEDAGILGDHFNNEASRSDSEWRFIGPLPGEPEPREDDESEFEFAPEPVSADGKKGNREAFEEAVSEWRTSVRSGIFFTDDDVTFLLSAAGRSAVLSLWGEPDTSATLAEAALEAAALRAELDETVAALAEARKEIAEFKELWHADKDYATSLAAQRDELKELVAELEKGRDQEQKWRQKAQSDSWESVLKIREQQSELSELRSRLSAPSESGDANVGIADHEDYETAGGYVLGEFTKFLNKHGEKRAKRLASLAQMLPRLKAALAREARP